MSCDVSNYSCNDLGTFLPLINEYTWYPEVRAFLYLLGLLWCFFGVAIVADVFMCAIEKITSRTRMVKMANPDSPTGFEDVEIKVWNNTVANLTLMALGSSAPEILMSVFEVVMNNFKAGDLGPGTIVGSAAFNLLLIVGVCIVSIPEGENRVIKQIKVFAVTAFFSVFAYVWMLFVLILITPDYVDLWEAILTLLFFPILVIVAYMVDKDPCAKKKDEEDMMMQEKKPGALGSTIGLGEGGKVDADTIRLILKSIGKHPDLSEEDAAKLAAALATEHESHSRLWYRIQATRNITGSNKLTPALNEVLQDLYEKAKERQDVAASRVSMASMTSMEIDDISHGGTRAVIEFAATSVAVMEKDGRVRLTINRYGRTNNRVLVKFETIDGTAESQSDYIPKKELLVFERDEVEKQIDVEIIDDNEWEPDEMFFAKIAVDTSSGNENVVIGRRSVCQVTIIDDDKPGIIEFTKPSFLFKESSGKALIPVLRRDGADGRITVIWTTEDMTAVNGRDYIGGEGELVFEHGEVTKMLEIPINDDQEAEKDEHFKITLSEPSPGVQLGRLKKTVVTIVNDDEFNGIVSRLVNTTNMNLDAMKVDHTTWSEQFQNAMNVNGGDIETASGLDYFLHFLTFAWKIIFAFIPPPSIWGGWLCFIISLIFIGILTIFIGDLARIFGCLVGLKDAVTAITFVAMGTSLPDLFASKNAASQEKYADNSIGNVTGSNSVNVFLGLGIPWVIAAAYWTAQGKSFYVPAGSVTFSVIIYTVCSLICIALIITRRYVKAFGGELGGNKVLKWVSFAILVTLWVLYVLLSAFNSYTIIDVSF